MLLQVWESVHQLHIVGVHVNMKKNRLYKLKDIIFVLPLTILLAGYFLISIYTVLFFIGHPMYNLEGLDRFSYKCIVLAFVLIILLWLWTLRELKNRKWEDELYKGLWQKNIVYNPLAGPIAYYYCIIRREIMENNNEGIAAENYLRKIKNKTLLDTIGFVYHWAALMALFFVLPISLSNDILILRISFAIIGLMFFFVVPVSSVLFSLFLLLICGSLPRNKWQIFSAFTDLKLSTILFTMRDFYYSNVRNEIVKD